MGKINFASLAGDTVEAVPGNSIPDLIRVRTEDVAPTPLNPRKYFGTDEELVELGESLKAGQVQPIVVVRRTAYLNLWPEHETEIGAAKWILVAGERRHRAAMKATIDFLDAFVRESFAESREAFVDAMIAENLDRKDMDPIEEAHAVETMVELCGNNAGLAAVRFRKTPAWISQRRGLLTLPSKFQRMVRAKTMRIKVARELAAWGKRNKGALEELTNLTGTLALHLGSGDLSFEVARELARLDPAVQEELCGLGPDILRRVGAGELSIELAREVVRLPTVEDQEEAVERALNRPAAQPDPSYAASVGVGLLDRGTGINPVNGTAASGRPEPGQATLPDPADDEPPNGGGGERHGTEPTSDGAATAAATPEIPKRVSVWSSPEMLADRIRQSMAPDKIARLVNLLVSE